MEQEAEKYKFQLGRFKISIRKILLTERVVLPWNRLRWDPVKSPSSEPDKAMVDLI